MRKVLAVHVSLGLVCLVVSFWAWASKVLSFVPGGYEPRTATAVKVVFWLCLISYGVAGGIVLQLWKMGRSRPWLVSVVWMVASLTGLLVVIAVAQPGIPS